jgi:hypothetical protein
MAAPIVGTILDPQSTRLRVFRDESMHMAFAFDVVATARREEPGLFTRTWPGCRWRTCGATWSTSPTGEVSFEDDF